MLVSNVQILTSFDSLVVQGTIPTCARKGFQVQARLGTLICNLSFILFSKFFLKLFYFKVFLSNFFLFCNKFLVLLNVLIQKINPIHNDVLSLFIAGSQTGFDACSSCLKYVKLLSLSLH